MRHTNTTRHPLTEKELLATFLPKSCVNQLLREYQSLYHILLHTSEAQLQAVPGVGRRNAKRIRCLQEVITKVQEERTKPIASITCLSEAIQCFQFLADRQQEELWALLLDAKNHILRKKQITIGTVNASLATPREVFHAAVQQMAAAVIVIHNHPSGDSSPSTQDTAMTKRLLEAGTLMNIQLLDHIIIGKYDCYSFRKAMNELWKEDDE
ncbi:JAB domain-containing protein [Megasphaera sueciensis]|uniref:JAB domain-containing protein n=1 Tax=Megasphaera sueciensis TaxID=349094 RepID=UPI003D06DD18